MVNRPDPRPAALQLQLLVLRCQAGDEAAFAALLDQFGDKTLRYLRGLLGDDADDVQQDVWLAVFRSIATLANPAAFRTWLFQTARYRAIDLLRTRARERELVVDAAMSSAMQATRRSRSTSLRACWPQRSPRFRRFSERCFCCGIETPSHTRK